MVSQVNSIRHFKELNSYSSTIIKKMKKKECFQTHSPRAASPVTKTKDTTKKKKERKSQMILLMNISA